MCQIGNKGQEQRVNATNPYDVSVRCARATKTYMFSPFTDYKSVALTYLRINTAQTVTHVLRRS